MDKHYSLLWNQHRRQKDNLHHRKLALDYYIHVGGNGGRNRTPLYTPQSPSNYPIDH